MHRVTTTIEITTGLIMEQFKPIEFYNFIEPAHQDEIYKYVTNVDFPWAFMEDATGEIANTPEKSTPSFGNLIYWDKNPDHHPHIEIFKPILAALEEKADLKIQELLRMRLGFLMNTKYSLPSMPYKHNTPHRDYDQEHYVAVYYVNRTDGETVIFNQTEPSEKYYPMHKCMPEKGKLLLFNGWHYHASTCPKVFTKRIALTINFTATKNG